MQQSVLKTVSFSPLYKRGIQLVGLVVVVIISVVIILYFKRHYNQDAALIRSLGVLGPVVSILLYSVFAFTPLPTDPLSVFNVAVYGPINGLIIICIGNTLAAIAEYTFGRTLSLTTNAQTYLTKLPFGLAKLPIDSYVFLIGGRLLPGYGSKIISIIVGMYHVRISRYIWTTLVTNIVGALLTVIWSYGLFKVL